jgi:hypothetical protein
MRHRGSPERIIDAFHFTDKGQFAICDDGTVWELEEVSVPKNGCVELMKAWRQLPSVPGTELPANTADDRLCTIKRVLKDMFFAAPETWGARIKGLIAEIDEMVGDE